MNTLQKQFYFKFTIKFFFSTEIQFIFGVEYSQSIWAIVFHYLSRIRFYHKLPSTVSPLTTPQNYQLLSPLNLDNGLRKRGHDQSIIIKILQQYYT